MGNKKRNKQKNRQNPNTNTNTDTEVLNTEAENKEVDSEITTEEQTEKTEEDQKSEKTDSWEEVGQREKEIAVGNTINQGECRKIEDPKAGVQEDINEAVLDQKNINSSDVNNEKNKKLAYKGIIKKEVLSKGITEIVDKETTETDTAQNDHHSEQNSSGQSVSRETSKKETKAVDNLAEQTKEVIMNVAKVLLPVAACAIVIAAIIAFVSSRKSQTVALNTDTAPDTTAAVTLSEDPLSENAYADVNELMRTFYTALADGDMDTVKAIKDYNTDREIITYEKKSEFIESYDNVNCYTKPGIEDNSYFVYATYDVKIKDIATEAPGLNAFYVYTADDGVVLLRKKSSAQ